MPGAWGARRERGSSSTTREWISRFAGGGGLTLVRRALPPFQSFLDAHRDAVWRFLVRSVGRAEAEDCFQETFIAALRAYPRLRPDSNLSAWVLTIAHRKALDSHHARSRRAVPRARFAWARG